MNSSMLDNYITFEEEVKRNFHFLEQQYDFHLSQIKQVEYTKIIRFVSPIVYVTLFYGPPSYEVGISFGRIGIDDLPGAYSFEQGDLIQLSSCSHWTWNAAYPNHLVGLVSEFSRLLRECGIACLRGDQSVYEEMKATRDRAVKAWHQEEKVNHIKKEAEIAWDRKDFSVVVDLYETIRDSLTETENKKLDYAKSNLIDGPVNSTRKYNT